MKKFDVNDYGVSNIDAQNAKTINGGWIPAAISIIGALIYCYNNADDFVDGFKDGYNRARE